MLRDVFVVGRDRLSILCQPSLALPPVDLEGQGFLQSVGKVDAELASLLQEVAVHVEPGRLLCRFPVVEGVAAFHVCIIPSAGGPPG